MEAFLDFERQAEVKDGGASIVDLRAVDADRRAGAARSDRRLQPRGLHRDPAAARLAARAEAAGRADRAGAAAGGAEADPGAQGRACRAERAAARRWGGACSAPARLPRPRAQARLVGLLRPDRDDARRARRGRRVDRPGRARQRPRAGEEVAGVRAQLPRAGAQDRAGAGRARPGDDGQRRRDPRARPRRAPADAEARAVARGRAAARVADPGRPVLDAGSGGRARPLRPLAARRRPPLSRARVGAPARAVRPAGADRRARGDEGARPLARRSATS